MAQDLGGSGVEQPGRHWPSATSHAALQPTLLSREHSCQFLLILLWSPLPHAPPAILLTLQLRRAAEPRTPRPQEPQKKADSKD